VAEPKVIVVIPDFYRSAILRQTTPSVLPQTLTVSPATTLLLAAVVPVQKPVPSWEEVVEKIWTGNASLRILSKPFRLSQKLTPSSCSCVTC
jgi:hypothetical protein